MCLSNEEKCCLRDFEKYLKSNGGHIGVIDDYLFRSGKDGIELRGSLPFIKPDFQDYYATSFGGFGSSQKSISMYGYRIPIVGVIIHPITGMEYFKAINGGFVTCGRELESVPESRRISKQSVIKKFS